MAQVSIRKLYETIVTSNSFEELTPFFSQSSWNSYSEEDKILLSNLFLLHGRKQLQEGGSGPLLSFHNAALLTGSAKRTLFAQAKLYAEFNETALAISLCRDILAEEMCPETAAFLAALLTRQGSQEEIEEAKELYDRLETESPLSQELLAQKASTLYACAKISGEASDFGEAIHAFKKVTVADPSLWNEQANAYVDLACLVNNQALLVEAADLYKKVVSVEKEGFEGWFNLACTLSHLWSLQGQSRHFQEAQTAFENAAKCEFEEFSLWLKWGCFLTEAGKALANPKLLEHALGKYLKASKIKEEHPLLLTKWAEAQLFYGVYEEKLEYLKWAEVLIQRALEKEPKETGSWALYGRVLVELGRYFEEEKYYTQAIEKLRFALGFDRSAPDLWHGLALAHHLLATQLEDAAILEQSLKFYARTAEFGGEMFPDYWNEWGVALLKMGELTGEERWVHAAVEKFEFAIGQQTSSERELPLQSDLLFNYGCALDYLGDLTQEERFYEKAIQIFTKAMKIDPEHPPLKFNLALAYAHLAEAVGEVECFERALDLFEEIVRDNPEDDLAYSEWAVAIMHLVELIHDPAHKQYIGRMLLDAEKKLTTAISLGNEPANYYMACLATWMGNPELALLYLRRAETVGGLPSPKEMMQDDWLKSLRHTPEFRAFISRLT